MGCCGLSAVTSSPRVYPSPRDVCVRDILQQLLMKRTKVKPGQNPEVDLTISPNGKSSYSSTNEHHGARGSNTECDCRLSQLLLHLARGIFEEQTNLEKLVQKIMLDAQDLLKCEKCSVYLLDDTLERDIARFTKAFMSRLGTYSRSSLVLAMQDPTSQLELTGNDPTNSLQDAKVHNVEDVVFSRAFELCSKDGAITLPNSQELAQSKTAYIAKFVVVKGEIVNIPDVDLDGRFGKGPLVDARGCRVRSVLCMPIQNSDKKIIGVTQLLNKNNGEPFNDSDVNIIEAFSIFTGLGIHNCQMYENVCQLMAKQSVALEVLSYHATAPVEEAQELAKSTIPTSEDLRLQHFDFDDMTLGDDGTLKACVRMFMEADLINIFRMPYEVICRWLCTVKKNYRPVTYHNWRHAFNVCQSMFTMLYTGELSHLFDDLEVLSLLAACLCHDLDHRGTNNAFQAKVASPLAMLYSTSVLEHHHFDHCIMILNSEGNNIFQSLPPNQYRRAIKFLEHAILSTDLALYFKKRGDFKKLVESGERSFVDPQHKSLLRAMMMTACDVAAVTKPWSIQHKTALLVTAEFFEQGDIERTQLGEQPIPMMDRNKKDELPRMQIGFIDAICTPIYKLFAIMTTKLEPMYAGCENNRDKWQELADEHDKNHAVQTAVESASQQEASTLQINADKQKSIHSQNIVNDPNGGGDKENQQTPLIINSVQTNFASPQTSELKNIPCTSPSQTSDLKYESVATTPSSPELSIPNPNSLVLSLSKQKLESSQKTDLHPISICTSMNAPSVSATSHLSITSISENNNELSTHSEPKHIQEIPRYCNSLPKESAQGATASIDNKDFAKSEPVDSNRTHDKTYDRPHSAQDVSKPQQEYPPKLHSQNGSLSDGQTTKSHDFASAPSCYVSHLESSPIPSHGKRKSHAQAHAYVSKDKGDRTQSGLCLVS